ncbi:DUF2478 domain-containing protein [Rhodoplanes sp. TEM]|uniref:DUF2478 domain-containing protein n=1 Tax=Rhodoplanes tepidamans TaxID=200616 RepID=A0ABT5J8T4_RHOTP|nr:MULTISPECIES: DUF2478 domain-containing protein [Rhodoplanes]MDC7786062.1 DUF2478 domain-containing protein [Rhodoplanes tepidamans]MDC7983797.1 DUF2478 domain-containing protein [Rhodoplanes sp. TEM]MDQ0354905.1 hypothetical protein [Rhodoplanes tepidamans]
MSTDLRELDVIAAEPAVAESDPPVPVAALTGATSAEIQRLLLDFAVRRAREGVRVVGVIEEATCSDGVCGSLVLRDLAGTRRIPISQNLGRESTACNLDSSGLAEACGLVQAAIAAGADLVILSKFGKVEADRHGLVEAFQDAIAAELPVVTSVAPPLAAAWAAFAGPLSAPVAADAAALEAWWTAQVRARAGV